jgi:hypothetical protein
MTSKDQTYVLDLTGKTKEAALYFDRVVPLTWSPAWHVAFPHLEEARFL